MSTVLQEWVCKLPWKQQSVLLSGLRGPDMHHYPKIKILTRWLRNVTQNNADPEHSYMMVETHLPAFEDMEKELEYCTIHYVHHLTQALKVIAIGCDNATVREYALILYDKIVKELLHLTGETDEEFYVRLADKVVHI